MVVFTALTYLAGVLMPGFAGSLSLFGMSPGLTAAVITAGRSAAWSLAGAALTRPNVPSQQVQATISQTDAPRIRAYGRNLLGGVRTFFEADDGRLHQLVVCHHGPVDGLVQFWIDGKPAVPESRTNFADGGGRYNRYTAVYFRNGTGNGGDYNGVFDGDGLNNYDLHEVFPTLWTAEHKLVRQASFYSLFGDPSDEDFAKFFPKGAYTVIQAEVRGSRVADLTGAQVYSENAGLCIKDLLTHPDGWGFDAALLEADSWAAFVSRCAEQVPLRTGGSEPRYRISGYYSLDEPLKDVTQRMLAVCDGQIYETAEGKIGILGGAWSEPDVTLTDADILGIQMRDGFDPLQTYNVLRGSFVSPQHAYQSIEVAPLEDPAALDREEVRSDQQDLDMCPSGSQLQRLMTIRMAKDRRAEEGTITTNMVGLKARFPKGDGIHTIRIRSDEFGVSGVYEVTSHAFDPASQTCTIGIASIENPYPWDPETQEKPLPPSYSSIPTPDNTTGNPANAVIFQESILVSSGVYGVRAVVTVDDPGRNDLKLEAAIAEGIHTAVDPDDEGYDDGVEWLTMAGTRLRASSSILNDATTYTVRIRWRGRTDWVSAGTITVTANANAPSAPTSLSVVAAGGVASLDWRNAATDFYRTQVWRSNSASIGSATLVATVAGVAGQVSSYDDDPPGASALRYYWVRTINGSGVQSAPAGPVTVTI